MQPPTALTQHGAEGIRSLRLAADGPQAQLHPGAPTTGLIHQPLTQLAEIQHSSHGASGRPVADAITRPMQLPAAPAVGDHRGRQAKTLHSVQRQGSAAEGSLGQILELIDQQHLNPSAGQKPGEFGARGPGSDDQDLGVE